MKIKKIKLLKALALTGAFGIVTTVPVIVSACSSTSDNNTGGEGNSGGGSQTQTITPQLKSSVSLSGALSNIYNPSTSTDTNVLVAEEIKNNLSSVFDNADTLSQVSDLTVTVNGGFSRTEWSGENYDAASGNWGDGSTLVTIEDANKLLYTQESPQINIASLNDLKSQLTTGNTLRTALNNAGANIAEDTTLAVNNNLGFTNNDLLHINVMASTSASPAVVTQYDLQIPVSDLNLVVQDLSVTVSGTNVGTANTTTTNFTYNIGINETVTQPTASAPLATADRNDADKALEALGYASVATGQTTYTYNNDAISQALGIYNCTFVPAADNPIAEDDQNPGTYTITLSATPNSGYVWEDGTNMPKSVSFTATFTNPTNP